MGLLGELKFGRLALLDEFEVGDLAGGIVKGSVESFSRRRRVRNGRGGGRRESKKTNRSSSPTSPFPP
jgi:hypothetical protein